jgi:hypothetical protein
MKCSEKSYQQQFMRPTRQLADDIEAPRIDVRGRNPMVVEGGLSPRAMDKPLAPTPLRRGRRASYVSQDAEFATNAGRRDQERQ